MPSVEGRTAAETGVLVYSCEYVDVCSLRGNQFIYIGPRPEFCVCIP